MLSVNTSLSRWLPPWLGIISWPLSEHDAHIRRAETLVFTAADPALEEVSRKYFGDCKELRSSDTSYDEGLASELWQVSEQLVERLTADT
jgi:hypothetical protein